MEPRHYISLATWSKDRIARLEALSNDLGEGAEMVEAEDTNVVSFSASIELANTQLNEAA